MVRKLAILALCYRCLLFGQNGPQKVQDTKTLAADFPTGGTLRLERPVGDVWIEAADQHSFELTTTKFRQDGVPGKVAGAKKALDRIRVTLARDGTDLVVRTEYPHHFAPPVIPWPGKARNFGIDYRIRIPKTAAVSVDHLTGELHINDLAGNVRASVSSGLIALRLPEDSQLAVDAKSTWGGVISDFAGKSTARDSCSLPPCSFATFPFGHRLEETAAVARQKLYLRVGFGDILILKEHNPKPSVPGI